MSKFKALDYNAYNSRFGFDKYKYLYDLMTELFALIPFDEKDFEDDTFLSIQEWMFLLIKDLVLIAKSPVQGGLIFLIESSCMKIKLKPLKKILYS